MVIRLQSLTIKNFRGIRDAQIEGLTDVNVLVGRNNSGKTSAIEAISRLAAAGSQRVASHVDRFVAYWEKVRPGLPSKFMWYGGDIRFLDLYA